MLKNEKISLSLHSKKYLNFRWKKFADEMGLMTSFRNNYRKNSSDCNLS